MRLNTWKKESNNLSLLDEAFLIALLEQKEREIYARIASLDVNEQPIEYIEGKVSDGSINIDGTSSVRRTCNLTMSVDDVDISDVYWGIKTKFRLEIGVKNNLTNEYQSSDFSAYPEIVWFPEGTYFITNFNTSIATKGYTISLSGKDKMVMLNGELGGQIYASVDFGQEQFVERIFVPLQTDIKSSEVLTTSVIYQKQPAEWIPPSFNEQISYISDNDQHIKFSKSVEGSWVKVERKYYRLSDLDYVGSGGVYTKQVPVRLSGLSFTPISGVIYTYKIKGTDNLMTLSRGDFPANINEEHDAILVYRQSNNNLQEYEVEVFEQMTFKSAVYDCYSLIEKPRDMFVQVGFTENNPYQAGKYYYQKEDTFILDQSKNPTEIYTYYELKPLYTLDESITIKKLPLDRIIKEMLHAHAKEPYHNIIVNDLDEYGLEQLTYKGDRTLYALRDVETGDFIQILFKEQSDVVASNVEDNSFQFDTLSSGLTNATGTQVQIQLKNKPAKLYTIAKFDYGDDIGYRITDLTYTGDLITNIGDSVDTVLKKIQEMLGEFEYFYDLDGRFVFQKKKTYVNTSWSQLVNNGDESYVTYQNDEHNQKFSFNFEGNRLVTAFNNSPVLTNLKNDFSVWGKRKDLAGGEVPIHARYAIDKKPKEYLAFNGVLYYTQEAIDDPSPDNRELIASSGGISGISESDFHDLTKIPPCLMETVNDQPYSDWWELSDWAEYYKALTDAYPTQYLKEYGTEGFVGTLVFGSGANNSQTFQGRGQLVIDFDKNSIPNNDTAPRTPLYQVQKIDGTTSQWWPFQHTFGGCYHWYSQYLGFYSSYTNMMTFIYKPRIPSADVIAKDGGRLKFISDESKLVDWRELIYRMAIDYFAGQGCSEKEPLYDYKGNLVINNPDHFLSAVAERNPYYFGTGYTGYEQYYTDMQGFWRQLYDPDYVPREVYKAGYYTLESMRESGSQFYKRTKIWHDATVDDFEIEYYFDQNRPEITQQYNKYIGASEYQVSEELRTKYMKYMVPSLNPTEDQRKRCGWNINIFDSPQNLNFWIEFLDDHNELAEYSIPMVGDRAKVVNEDKVRAIYYKEIPSLILCPNRVEYGSGNNSGWMCDLSDLKETITREGGYKFIYLPKGFAKYFEISYRSLSAKDKIDELLYQYAYCIENVTITALPVYHLEPNTRIYVRDDTTRVNGEYIVTKITLPLSYKGTMSISANKAPERLY